MAGNLQIGQTIGDYRVEQVLGNGHFGVVYQVSHLLRFETNRYGVPDVPILFALKELQHQEPDYVDYFNHEAKVLEMLSGIPNSNLVQFGEQFEENGKRYIVMQFVRGHTLEEECEQPIPEELLIRLAIELCRGLIVMHEHQPPVIHRDVKLENVRVRIKALAMGGSQVELTILDFGIASILDGSQVADGLGSPYYAHPTQLKKGICSLKFDQHGLGAVLFALIRSQISKTEEGRHLPFPYERWTNVAEQQAVMSQYRKSVQQLAVDTHHGVLPSTWDAYAEAKAMLAKTSYSKALQDIVLQMITFDDKHKFRTLAVAKRKLEQLQNGKKPSVFTPTLPLPQTVTQTTAYLPTQSLHLPAVAPVSKPVPQPAPSARAHQQIQGKTGLLKQFKWATKLMKIVAALVACFLIPFGLILAIRLVNDLRFQAQSKVLVTDDSSWGEQSAPAQWSADSQSLLFITKTGEITILNVVDGSRKNVINVESTFPKTEWVDSSDVNRIYADAYWTSDQQHIVIEMGNPPLTRAYAYEIGVNGGDLKMLASSPSDSSLYLYDKGDFFRGSWLVSGTNIGQYSPNGKWAIYSHANPGEKADGVLYLYTPS